MNNGRYQFDYIGQFNSRRIQKKSNAFTNRSDLTLKLISSQPSSVLESFQNKKIFGGGGKKCFKESQN